MNIRSKVKARRNKKDKKTSYRRRTNHEYSSKVKARVRVRVRRSSGRRELCTSIECFSSLDSVRASDLVQVKLILKEQLDRETQVQHRMTLVAVDGGPHAKTGTTSIIVNVIDSNDNKPVFVGGPTFEVNVVENTPPGTVIIRLEAHDADEGPNGQVLYSFAPSTLNSPAVRVFSIRNDTGELTVKVCTKDGWE